MRPLIQPLILRRRREWRVKHPTKIKIRSTSQESYCDVGLRRSTSNNGGLRQLLWILCNYGGPLRFVQICFFSSWLCMPHWLQRDVKIVHGEASFSKVKKNAHDVQMTENFLLQHTARQHRAKVQIAELTLALP